MARLFGTDGVRGVANRDLTPLLAYKLGRAGAIVLAQSTFRRPNIVVACDTRISCDMLECALVSGICSTGASAICLGVVPTPAVAYLTRLYEADAGIMISASHNSFEFNGIKFFSDQGHKLLDETEDMIEKLVHDDSGTDFPFAENVGRRKVLNTAGEDYIKYVESTVDVDFSGLKIVSDCANGASYKVAPELFRRLGAEIIVMNDNPDGLNINKKCGSGNTKYISQKVRETGADLGLAFDGDADRLICVDENGEVVDGDAIITILSLDLKKKGLLVNNTIVVTVMSNMGVDVFAKKHGINVVKTQVGDRYVLEEMLRSGCIIGGEQSGHVIMLQHNTTGDGLITAVQLVRVLKNEGCRLSDLASVFTRFPQVVVNAKVRDSLKHKFMEDDDIAAMCRSLEDEFGENGRVLIRPSGTEPLVRVMIEGENTAYIKHKAELLAALIESRLGT